MKNTTVEDVVKEIRKLADKRPDFNYRAQPMKDPTQRGLVCSYVSASRAVQDGEGCIVGQALTNLGVTKAQLRSVEGVNARQALVNLGLSRHGDKPMLEWIEEVQVGQDDTLPWSEAVRQADMVKSYV